MAGNYPDVPGPRLQFDIDGTAVYSIDNAFSSLGALVSQANLAALLDESSTVPVTGGGLVFIFPELRDLVGVFIRYGETSTGSQPTIGPFYTSANSTNGIDGTWTSQGTKGVYSTSISVPDTRNTIQSLAVSGVKAVRFAQGGGGATITYRGVNIYGSIASGETPDRLRLWHPTLDQEITGAYFDWGDIPRSSTGDRTFRVKNNSSTLTANSILLSMEGLTTPSPTMVSQHTFSPDGSTFTSTLNIGNLSPGSISSVLTLRRTIPSNAALSLWSARILAVAGSWT